MNNETVRAEVLRRLIAEMRRLVEKADLDGRAEIDRQEVADAWIRAEGD